MKTEKEFNKAVAIIKRLVKTYPYVAEECGGPKGKPCSQCVAILKAKEFIKDK